jgi:hypothetical protein
MTTEDKQLVEELSLKMSELHNEIQLLSERVKKLEHGKVCLQLTSHLSGYWAKVPPNCSDTIRSYPPSNPRPGCDSMLKPFACRNSAANNSHCSLSCISLKSIEVFTPDRFAKCSYCCERRSANELIGAIRNSDEALGCDLISDGVQVNSSGMSISPRALQDLLDELERSRASRRRAWENLQEIRWVLKDTAGMDLEPPARKSIDLEGRRICCMP